MSDQKKKTQIARAIAVKEAVVWDLYEHTIPEQSLTKPILESKHIWQ